jgi:hypothetical protein
MTSAAGLPFPQPALFSLSRKETVAEISLAYFQHLQESNCRLRNLTFMAG